MSTFGPERKFGVAHSMTGLDKFGQQIQLITTRNA